MKTDFMLQKFDSIQALRGIAALFVVVSHLAFVGVGAFGVDIFFCISGFIMMYVTEKDTKHFLVKRLIRIVPLYYLITVFTFVLLLIFPTMFMTTTADVSYLVKSFLFIPYEIGDVIQPIVRVGWTINYEMFFYVLFFISMKISQKYRAVICSIVLVILAVVGEIVAVPTTILKFYCDELLIEFVFGMLSFYLCKKIFSALKDKNSGKYRIVLGAFCAVAIAVCFWLLIFEGNNFPITHFYRLLNWGVPAFVIFVAVFTLGCMVKIPKCLSYLGDISFSVYLLHYYPITLLSRISDRFDSIWIKLGMGIIGIVVVIGVSAVSYLIIEKKLSSYLRKRLHI